MFGEEKTGMLLVSSCFTLVCRELSSSPRMREGAGGGIALGILALCSTAWGVQKEVSETSGDSSGSLGSGP